MRTTSSRLPGSGCSSFFRLSSWLPIGAPLLLVGCQLVGGSGPSPPSPQSAESTGPESGQGVVYQGFIEIEGGNLSAALEIVLKGRREARGALQAASGLMAEGEGQLRGQTLSLELLYGGDCPGRMSLEGEWDQGLGTYEGTVEASDCTGKGQGHFRFSAS